MGTRLYPKGVSVELMEKLAGVPAGTHARLQELETTKPVGQDYATEEAWYDKLFADEDLHVMHSFDLFGWGRLTGEAVDYIIGLGMGQEYGEIEDPIQVQELLRRQGVVAPEVTKVSWS